MRRSRDERFRALAWAVFPRLRRLGFLLCADWSRAQDLAATGLAEACADRAGLRDEEAFGARAQRGLVRAWLAESREQTPTAETTPLDETELTRSERLLAALLALEPRRRAGLVLMLWEDLTAAEAAPLLRRSPASVQRESEAAFTELEERLGGSLVPADVKLLVTAALRDEPPHELTLDAVERHGEGITRRRRTRRLAVAATVAGVLSAGAVLGGSGSPDRVADGPGAALGAVPASVAHPRADALEIKAAYNSEREIARMLADALDVPAAGSERTPRGLRVQARAGGSGVRWADVFVGQELLADAGARAECWKALNVIRKCQVTLLDRHTEQAVVSGSFHDSTWVRAIVRHRDGVYVAVTATSEKAERSAPPPALSPEEAEALSMRVARLVGLTL